MRRTAPRMVKAPERDWTEARAKVDRERLCRVCEARGPLEAAHVVNRGAADESHPDGGHRLIVRAVDVVPLCAACHRAYDGRTLNLLPFLTPDEQTRAVQVAGGIVRALQRTTSMRWAPVEARP
jgi:hypothetical protein